MLLLVVLLVLVLLRMRLCGRHGVDSHECSAKSQEKRSGVRRVPRPNVLWEKRERKTEVSRGQEIRATNLEGCLWW